ncbi:MAG: hypothetical protein H0U74_09990 [Bradymonadaceae bacterium]|nr:hypothetical protein [Lujinxingiaceae bacterium]
MNSRWPVLGRVALLVAVLGAAACSDDGRTKSGGSCENASECKDDLVCQGNVCVEPTPNNNEVDAGPDAVEQPIEPEDYRISYSLEKITTPKTYELRLLSGDSDIKLNPDNVSCGPPQECMVSLDLKHFVYTRDNADSVGTLDVYVATITDEMVVDGDGELLVSSVRGPRLVDNHLTYSRTENNLIKAFYRVLGTADEVFIANLAAVGSSEGTWFIDPKVNKGVVYLHDLQTMDVFVGDLGRPITNKVFTVNSENFQDISGSYFGGYVPTAFSADGKYLSFLTTAPNDYARCQMPNSYDAPECTGPGQKCGRFKRCTAQEVTLHFIEIARMAELDDECIDATACGSVHHCDAASDTEYDTARCIAGRTVFGLPKSPYQGSPATEGCVLTHENPAYQYTDLRGPLGFGPDGKLYAVAARRCDELNIEKTDIIRVDPVTRAYEVVWGNDWKDYADGNCYDDQNRRVDVTNCVVQVRNAQLSPQGKELVFLATNPNVTDPGLAGSTMDLWSVRRNGLAHDWIGKHSIINTVQAYTIHPQ